MFSDLLGIYIPGHGIARSYSKCEELPDFSRVAVLLFYILISNV